MSVYNFVSLIGNVGQEPKIKYLEKLPAQQGGQSPKMAIFSVATTERYRDRNGNIQENTEWHSIKAWRGLADTVEKYVHKGDRIAIQGHIHTGNYTDNTGAEKYVTEIIADSLALLGSRPKEQKQEEGGRWQGGQSQRAQELTPVPEQAYNDDIGDDLPF